MLVSHTTRIAAPAARVWELMTDVQRWPDFAPQFKSIVRNEQGPLAMGTTARVTPHGFFTAVWVVNEYTEGRSFTWECDMLPGAHLVAGHVVKPDGDGASVTLSLEFSGPTAALLLPVLAVISRRNTRQAAEGMKAYCEGGAP